MWGADHVLNAVEETSYLRTGLESSSLLYLETHGYEFFVPSSFIALAAVRLLLESCRGQTHAQFIRD